MKEIAAKNGERAGPLEPNCVWLSVRRACTLLAVGEAAVLREVEGLAYLSASMA